MKVGEAGEAFFVVEGGTDVPPELRTSPIVAATHISQPSSLLLDPTISSTDSPLDANPDELDTLSDSIVDTTLDTSDPTLTSLHIQDTDSLDGHATSFTRHTLSNSERLSSSPPWSWQWGGLPEREDNVDNVGVEERLASTRPPAAVTMPVEKEPDSLKSETILKVDNQEASKARVDSIFKVDNQESKSDIQESPKFKSDIQESSKSDTMLRVDPIQPISKGKLARDQDLNDLNICKELTSYDKVEVSLCGPLDDFGKLDSQTQKVLFESNKVEELKYFTNPGILTSPTVIVKLNGYFHNWDTASQIMMSRVAFSKDLDQQALLKVFKKTKTGWFSWSKSETSSPSLPAIHLKSPEPKRNYAKSLRLNSSQLKSLNLKPGCNDITFSVHTPLQGLALCHAHIYLWDYTTKIIISDVDGTITKSDVLGHVFNMVGRDWTHPGVASLYTSIHTNGYSFLYLTSRAIGQASSTRDYLAKVAQDTSTLPPGPLLLSPARLIQALRREVIERRPQEFKMSCLKDIKKLFPGRDPFYAGFGNRITDAISYRSVGIPSSRIFTIDSNGIVQLELLANYATSYVKLRETVDQVFRKFY